MGNLPELLLFVVGVAVVQMMPTVLRDDNTEGRVSNEYLQLDEAFLIPMFVMFSFWETLAGFLIAVSIAHAYLLRPWYKYVFNMVQVGLSVAFAFWVAQVTFPWLGAATYSILSMLAVAGIVRATGGHFVWEWPVRGAFLVSSLLMGTAMSLAIFQGYLSLFPFAAAGVVGLQMWVRSTQDRVPEVEVALETLRR